MIDFRSDYLEGAHQSVLDRLAAYNMQQSLGYGEDDHCARAADRIRELVACPTADVHFVSGGTQANLTVISAILRPHQGVLSAITGHISEHEAGAIEATGHKVLVLPEVEGRISPQDVEAFVDSHYADASFEHWVQPGMVYISNTTERGGTYSKAQLTALSDTCKKLNLPLFIDGARLGYALAEEGTDLKFTDLPKLCDVFALGGTKQGALFGEAIVVVNEQIKKDFRYIIKQKGGMLAKGWLLGLQFEALLEGNRYLDLSAQANRLATTFRDALLGVGVAFLTPSNTNQQFPILQNSVLDSLKDKYGWSTIKKVDDARTAVRFCFSWARTESDLNSLLRDMKLALEK